MSEMTFTILDANRAIFSRRHDEFLGPSGGRAQCRAGDDRRIGSRPDAIRRAERLPVDRRMAQRHVLRAVRRGDRHCGPGRAAWWRPNPPTATLYPPGSSFTATPTGISRSGCRTMWLTIGNLSVAPNPGRAWRHRGGSNGKRRRKSTPGACSTGKSHRSWPTSAWRRAGRCLPGQRVRPRSGGAVRLCRQMGTVLQSPSGRRRPAGPSARAAGAAQAGRCDLVRRCGGRDPRPLANDAARRSGRPDAARRAGGKARSHVDWDLQDRGVQWSFTSACPPALSETSAAFRRGGFGTHENVLYYELVRHLVWSCWQRVVERWPGGRQPSPPRNWLRGFARSKRRGLANRTGKTSAAGRRPR